MDENSVKVEGTGSAVITDISVESLPNREDFEDVYPQEDSSDEDESDEETLEPEELRDARAQEEDVLDKINTVNDSINSIDKRLIILDSRSDTADKTEEDKAARLSELLATYKTERATLWDERCEATVEQRRLWKEMDAVRSRIRKLAKALRKETREKDRAKVKEDKRKERRRADRREERARVLKEHIKFWPKQCYTVTVTLDVNTMTPMSSRRQSVSSDVDVVRAVGTSGGDADEEVFQDCISCNLRLSYVTTAAKWIPSYDLQLSTTGATATLCFDAKISNQTSETWKNCKVSLSTSDATLSGIDSELPELSPWRIRLAGKNHSYIDSDDHITRSRNETQEYRSFVLSQKNRTVAQKPRSQMFGLADNAATSRAAYGYAHMAMCNAEEECDMDDEMDVFAAVDQASESKAKKKLASGSERMRRGGPPMPPPPPRPMVAMAAAPRMAAPSMAAPGGALGGGGGYGAVNPYAAAPNRYDAEPDVVDFEDSFVEEAGMTTNYDLPGLKTLAPKSRESKQRVARITFASVTLSHSVVAKYRPVAYLQAKLKNNSKLTLLKGPAGLTLDGSFMGHTAIPRCSPGDVFTLNLGVDPAIKVAYPKPDVRRATTGLFSKENSSVFARSVVLHNTRAAAGKPAQLHVLDQVPVSEDERLRVDVVTPRGLSLDGAVIAGAPGREEDNRDREWGKATAQMKKGGEVSWDVKLNAGKMVKLWLEYAVSAPSGDVAVEC